MGAAPVSVGRQEELWGVDVGKSLYCGFCGKECGKAWSAGSGLVSLNNPGGSGAQGLSLPAWYWALGLIRAAGE